MQRRRDQQIRDMREHLARLDEVDEAVEAKLEALERTRNPGP
jgi:voltage-gated potassium channel